MHIKIAVKVLVMINTTCIILAQYSPIHSLCYQSYVNRNDPTSTPANPNAACRNAIGIQMKELPLTCGIFTEKERRGYGPDDGFLPEEADSYETEDPAYFLDSGHGVCGKYKSDSTIGLCLWTGTDPSGTDPKQAGWLNGALNVNCNKKIWIMRENQEETRQLVPLIDGCTFNTYNISDADTACQQVYLTEKLYYDFKPTDEERESGMIRSLVWNFADGTENNPV